MHLTRVFEFLQQAVLPVLLQKVFVVGHTHMPLLRVVDESRAPARRQKVVKVCVASLCFMCVCVCVCVCVFMRVCVCVCVCVE